jgi:hypothetical protein
MEKLEANSKYQKMPILQMEELHKGDTVKFVGCSKEQINWGNNDDPNKLLFVGDKYVIEKVEVHSQHTKLTLRGVYGRFNSTCFEKV